MKIFLLLFVLLTSLSRAQCINSVFPNNVYYPGQTVSIPTSSLSVSMYLCGPATVVYDTLDPVGMKARIVFVSSGSTYHYKSSLPANSGLMLWAKNGSTVIIYPSTTTGTSITIDKEPGATVTNLSTGTITINNCTMITGPPISCSPAAIGNLNIKDTQTSVWPNPAHDKLFISSESGKDKTVSVVNLMGETIYSLKGIKDEKQEISLSTFASGIYYIVIKCDGVTETKKIVIAR